MRLNGITVTTRMRALATGGLGETIPLSTPDGREKIFAKVTGYHEAEVSTRQKRDLGISVCERNMHIRRSGGFQPPRVSVRSQNRWEK